MGYLFPVNPVTRSKSEDKMPPVEKIGDDEKDFGKNEQNHHQDFDQLEDKVKKLIRSKKFIDSLDLKGLDSKTKTKLLELVQDAAASFLKKELLNVAKSILSISVDEHNHDELDEEDLSFSDHLARLVMKLASNKQTLPKTSVSKKVGRANPLEDKNAGFLVHYCKDILNQEIKQRKNEFKLQKLNKKDLLAYLKK